MDLIRIVGVLVTLFSFFIRGVVVFKGLEIEQFLFTVNLGRIRMELQKYCILLDLPFVPLCNARQSAS